MRERQYVVINRAATGNLVAVIVEAWSAQDAVERREAGLRRGGYHVDIIAATQSHPGPHGLGGRVLRKVNPPPPPRGHRATNQKLDTL